MPVSLRFVVAGGLGVMGVVITGVVGVVDGVLPPPPHAETTILESVTKINLVIFNFDLSE